jgi:hypothetical protein
LASLQAATPDSDDDGWIDNWDLEQGLIMTVDSLQAATPDSDDDCCIDNWELEQRMMMTVDFTTCCYT